MATTRRHVVRDRLDRCIRLREAPPWLRKWEQVLLLIERRGKRAPGKAEWDLFDKHVKPLFHENDGTGFLKLALVAKRRAT